MLLLSKRHAGLHRIASFFSSIMRLKANPRDESAIKGLIERWLPDVTQAVRKQWGKSLGGDFEEAVHNIMAALYEKYKKDPAAVTEMVEKYETFEASGGRSRADSWMKNYAVKGGLNQAHTLWKKKKKEQAVGEGGKGKEEGEGRGLEERVQSPEGSAEDVAVKREDAKEEEAKLKSHMHILVSVMKEIREEARGVKLSELLQKNGFDFKDWYFKEIGYSSYSAFEEDVERTLSLVAGAKYDHQHALQMMGSLQKIFEGASGKQRGEDGSRAARLSKLLLADEGRVSGDLEQAIRDRECLYGYKQNISNNIRFLKQKYTAQGTQKTDEEIRAEAEKYVRTELAPKEIQRSQKKNKLPTYCDLELLLGDTPEGKRRRELAEGTRSTTRSTGTTPQQVKNAYDSARLKFTKIIKRFVTALGEGLIKGYTALHMEERIKEVKESLRAALESLSITRFALSKRTF